MQSPRRCAANPNKIEGYNMLIPLKLEAARSDIKVGHSEGWFNQVRAEFLCTALLQSTTMVSEELAGYPGGWPLVLLTIRDFVLPAAGHELENDFPTPGQSCFAVVF
jgi:hypothetical protein